MDRMMYLVAPVSDQLDWDEDGPVSRDLFVWAIDASEAIKLWREYYDLDQEDTTDESSQGLSEPVRVFEVPIMQSGARSTVIGWDHVHAYGATITERHEL
jgi:hypothetical protein